MRLASRLHMPLQSCRRAMGAREFAKWQKYLEEQDRIEWERAEKWEYYAAQVSANILRAAGAKGVKDSDHIIKFKSKRSKKQEKTVEQRTNEAKLFWSTFFAAQAAASGEPKKGTM